MHHRPSPRFAAMFVALLSATLALVATPTGITPAQAVVGGTAATGNTAVVRILNGNSSCSGALWTSRIVITAAHCVVTSAGTVTTRPMSIYAPGVNTQQSPQTVSQSAILTVDGWRKLGEFSQADDIAFVILSAELPGVSISRLATTDEVTAWAREARVVTFLGYGRTSATGASSPTPNSIDQPLSTSPTWTGGFTAIQTAAAGICSGDSGGPVVTGVGGELVLIGVSSAASGPCSASSRPSMTGFVANAYPDLVRRALELTSSSALPTVTTGSAIGISTTSAILNATAMANNLLTTVSFTYGLQADLSGTTTTVDAGQLSGATPTAVELAVANLTPGTTYFFRANATNVVGTATGAITSFVTAGGIPVVTSGMATTITSDSATLAGTVGANSVTTQAFFQYSRVPDFSVLDGTVVAGDVTGSELAALTTTVTGLEAGTTYYWRLAATNTAGASVGASQSFSTPVFKRAASLSTAALLTILAIDRTNAKSTVLTPVAKSKSVCSVNPKTSRITFAKSGVCRVRLVIRRADVASSMFLNLTVK